VTSPATAPSASTPAPGSGPVEGRGRGENALLLVAVLVTVLAWASAFVVIRGVAPSVGGGALALGRLAVGTVALAVILLVQRGWVRPTGREWLLVVVCGIGWFGAYNVALNLAEETLDAGTTAMIVGVGPILIALGAGLIFRDGISRWLGVGLALAFVGVVLIGVAAGAHFGDGAGVLMALVAAVTYAIGVLAQKPTLRRLPGSQVTFLACAIGLVFCLPFAPQLVTELTALPSAEVPAAVGGIAYLGIVPTALAFSTWAYALRRLPAGQLGVTTYVVPPLVIVMGLLFFGEVPVPLAILGGVVCLAGVAVSRRRGRPRAGV
jgi:drug/metabolite transporter (DMT)-like permease